MSEKKEHQTRSRAASAKTGSNPDLNGLPKIPEVKTEDTTSLPTNIETVVTQSTSNEEHVVQTTEDLNPIDENVDNQFENDDENDENHEDLNLTEVTSQIVGLQEQVDELATDVQSLLLNSNQILEQAQYIERVSVEHRTITMGKFKDVEDKMTQLQDEMRQISEDIRSMAKLFQENNRLMQKVMETRQEPPKVKSPVSTKSSALDTLPSTSLRILNPSRLYFAILACNNTSLKAFYLLLMLTCFGWEHCRGMRPVSS